MEALGGGTRHLDEAASGRALAVMAFRDTELRTYRQRVVPSRDAVAAQLITCSNTVSTTSIKVHAYYDQRNRQQPIEHLREERSKFTHRVACFVQPNIDPTGRLATGQRALRSTRSDVVPRRASRNPFGPSVVMMITSV